MKREKALPLHVARVDSAFFHVRGSHQSIFSSNRTRLGGGLNNYIMWVPILIAIAEYLLYLMCTSLQIAPYCNHCCALSDVFINFENLSAQFFKMLIELGLYAFVCRCLCAYMCMYVSISQSYCNSEKSSTILCVV